MKTYSTRSNAKRAAIKTLIKARPTDEAKIKVNPDQYFIVEVSNDGKFYPHYISDRVGGVSAEKEAELKVAREKVNPWAKQCDDFIKSKSPKPEVFDKKPEPKGSPTGITGIKIEKNRDEQNGIKRPSAGGKCRQVWDACDELYSEGAMPMPDVIKILSDRKGWNVNNALIEMYQWRKFHGIRGRQKSKGANHE